MASALHRNTAGKLWEIHIADKFTEMHLRTGIDSLKQLINKGPKVKHLYFDYSEHDGDSQELYQFKFCLKFNRFLFCHAQHRSK